jgi:hypothetical protein
MLDHKGHQVSGVASDAEKLEVILLNKGLEDTVCCDSDPVAVCLLEDLAKGNERLDIATRSNNLDDYIEARRGDLVRPATKVGRDVGWWKNGFRLSAKLMTDRWCQKIGQASVLGVDVDVNTAII